MLMHKELLANVKESEERVILSESSMNHTLQAAIYRLYSSKLLQLFNSCEGSKLLLTNQGLSVPKGVLLIQHGTNLMRSKLLIAWLITLQAATRRGVLKHDKHSTNAVL